jgi:hypothetical protein
MRLAAVVGILASGCAPAGRSPEAQDASVAVDASADADTDARFDVVRLGTSVVTDGSGVVWSVGAQTCPVVSGGCSQSGPTVLLSSFPAGAATTLISSPNGAKVVVGDTSAAFVATEVAGQQALYRVTSGGSVTQLSTAGFVGGPALDDQYVYWFEAENQAFKRALRTGDGTDAATVVTGVSTPQSVVVAGGYLWWIVAAEPSELDRVATGGGTPEVMLTNVNAIGASADVAYVSHFEGSGIVNDVLAIAADGSVQTVAGGLTQAQSALFMVADGVDVFWAGLDGGLYRVHDGGALELIPGFTRSAFGVTADQILFDFTSTGYAAIPR